MEDDENFAAAVQAAKSAKAVVVAVGIDSSFEGENGDYRAISGEGIALPGAQASLVDAVAAASSVPVVAVVTGSSVDISSLKSNPKVGSILWTGYSGEAAGKALADVLFGIHNPDGRLTNTFYPATFVTAWKSGTDPYEGGEVRLEMACAA